MSACTLSPGIRVYLLIENRLLREALGRLLRKRGDFQVIGVSEFREISVPDLNAANCDVLVIDFFDPNCLPSHVSTGSSDTPDVRTVLIGMNGESEQFLDAVRAGVNGYLLKDASAAEVIAAIRATVRGECVCPPKLSATLFRQLAQGDSQSTIRPPGVRSELTLRQHQLVNLIEQGLTNKEIAAKLHLSEFTIRNHVHRILRQVAARSRREAVDVIRSRSYSAHRPGQLS
jgi:DNA-binding NarL/FixJ family response regulator